MAQTLNRQWQQGRGGHNDQGRRGDHPGAKGGQPWQGGQHRFHQPGWGNGWGGGRRGGGGGNNWNYNGQDGYGGGYQKPWGRNRY